MKCILSFILFCMVSQSALGQLNVWRWQNPSVQGSTLTGVQMLSLTTIVACGNRGTFIKSTDGGITWDVKNLLLADSLNFYGLNFLDGSYGMVCGENGLIYKTTDGGTTWTKLSTPTISALRGIVIVDHNIVITVGDGGAILKTTDGGTSWIQSTFESSNNYTSVRMLRPDFITITGRIGLLYKSVDEGLSWQRITLAADTNVITNDIYGQVFYNDNTAIIVGDLGGIFSTTDGCKTWKNQSVEPISAATLRSIDGKDPSGNIYATVGEYGAIFQTANGGSNWNHIILGITDTLNAISFFDQHHAIAVGRNGLIFNTTDGGGSWTYLPKKPLTDPLYGIAFPIGDTSLGIAVGSYGAIMRTTNGGTKWDIIPGVTALHLSSVTFLDSSELCAVGQNGTVLRSHDAGMNWEFKTSGTMKYLRSVNFPTPNFGWAVGDSGIVLSTTDAGISWTIHQQFSRKRYFAAVAFTDSIHGYLGSDHGIYSTTDGGVTWADPDDVTYYFHCTSISTPSANVVCFTHLPCDFSDNSGILISNDQGKNWKSGTINNPVNDLLYGVFFADDLHGTAVGIYYPGKQPTGYIVHTTDGGLTWNQQDSHTSDGLNAVIFGTKSAGTAVGGTGNIMRTTTDE